MNPCDYPVIIKNSSSFDYANGQHVRKIPVVSYELREALRQGEIRIDDINGWLWNPSERATNPFEAYVDHFYGLKNAHRENYPLYIRDKLLLNCLYGKTYQAIRTTDYEEEPEYIRTNGRLVKNRILYRAGGLYLPHVGAWITSLCRAQLHEDLHRYQAIDCATDSFKTRETVNAGDGLGELNPVCEGMLLLIRPKLYVMFSDKVQQQVARVGDLRRYLQRIELESLRFSKEIVKYACHGFWGNAHELLRLYRDKDHEYLVRHMTKIRESIRQRKRARIMETQRRKIRINWDDERGLCGFRKNEALRSMELCTDNCFTCAYK